MVAHMGIEDSPDQTFLSINIQIKKMIYQIDSKKGEKMVYKDPQWFSIPIYPNSIKWRSWIWKIFIIFPIFGVNLLCWMIEKPSSAFGYRIGLFKLDQMNSMGGENLLLENIDGIISSAYLMLILLDLFSPSEKRKFILQTFLVWFLHP